MDLLSEELPVEQIIVGNDIDIQVEDVSTVEIQFNAASSARDSSDGISENQRRTAIRPKPYICTTCNKAFVTEFNLKTHERVHTGERPHVCTVCNKGFTQSSNLNVHFRIHTKEKRHKCPVCHKSFTRIQAVKYHLNHRHAKDNSFPCAVCECAFRTERQLAEHSLEHTGEKPHKCYVCGKAFVRLGNKNAHQRTHNNW